MFGQKAQGGTEDGSCKTKFIGDVSRTEAVPFVRSFIVEGRKWLVRWGAMSSQVYNTAGSGAHGAKGRISTEAMANDFAGNSILLSGEFQGNKSCGVELGISRSGSVEALSTDVEDSVH